MFFNSRIIFQVALASLFALEINALVLKPITTVPKRPNDLPAKREGRPPGVQLVPIRDAGEITGRFTKRERQGKSCYDPSSENEFLWGAYGKYISRMNAQEGVNKNSHDPDSLTDGQRATTSTWQISPSEHLETKSLFYQSKILQKSSNLSGVASLEKE